MEVIYEQMFAVNKFFFSFPHLEDFDLAGGRVEVFCVFFILILFKSVNLDAKRYTLFPTMLSHGELRADAVYLNSKGI